MNRIHHEMKRLVRFEPGEVTSLDESTGLAGLTTPGRDYPRSETGNAYPTEALPGQRMVILGGGDNEMPLTLGFNPWIV